METMRAAGAMPAQLTTTRSGAASVARAMAALTSSSLVTSAAMRVMPSSMPCSTALSIDCWRSEAEHDGALLGEGTRGGVTQAGGGTG
ncbi:hypothetical protein A6035_17600 (plasmid) [Dietzia lutea]|uniref:Uncharacterized protein n=1 Tax=Dietzia lutea TaxID=546160 RepID=A0A2S1RD37_9ACTN|nr:hypothetical protein [Dietzia lutea]AWH94151.1 hypothetical protein A6035_17600 [Dietzia lutea]